METEREKIILEEALKYTNIGFSVIPLGKIKKISPTKKVIDYPIKWKEFQTRLATPEEIRGWRCENIGIVTGLISGILVVDFDRYKETYDHELEKYLQLSITPTSQTAGGGTQCFFKLPSSLEIKNDVCIGHDKSGIDIRASGGMVVAPPSKTSYGEYTWLISPFDEPLAEIPPRLLELLKEGSKGIKIKKKLPELVGLKEGQGRNNAMASFVGKLLLTVSEENWDSEVWPTVKEVNNTYKPPLDPYELRTVYESITKTEAERKLGFNNERAVMGEIKMEIISWEEFSKKEFTEVPWRIKDLIPKEGFVILSAISGEKKTWVALEMANNISEGSNFLGTEMFKTEQGKVLYVDQENPERDLARRGKQLGIKGKENFFLYRPDSLNLNDENVAKKFLELIVNNNFNVVFIDTLRAVAGGLKEDKAEDVRMFFNRFKILKDKGVVIIFLDHLRKPQNFEGKIPKKEQLLGSQDKTASVEILLQLSSKSGTDEIRVYQAKNRLDREISPFKIMMKDIIAEDGTKTTSLIYDGEIDEENTKKDEAKIYILELLHEGSQTTKEITKVLSTKKIGGRNTRDALKELMAEGKIDMGKKGKENLYFLVSSEQINNQEDDLVNF
ncbi:MAG: AAA family ATPase [bacterium]